MKFKMNDRNWEIKEISQDMFVPTNDPKEQGSCFGLCAYDEQVIYLWKDLHKEQKRRTLMHELLHCYIGCFISFEDISNYPEDVMCNICANSHDIIHKIVEDYFAENEIIKLEMDKIKCDVENLTKLNKGGNI